MVVNSDLSEDLGHCVTGCNPAPLAPSETHEGRYMRAGFLFIELRWEEDQYADQTNTRKIN